MKVNKTDGSKVFSGGSPVEFSVVTDKAQGITVANIIGNPKLFVVEDSSSGISVFNMAGTTASIDSSNTAAFANILSFNNPGGITADVSGNLLYITQKVQNQGDPISVDVIDISVSGSPTPASSFALDSNFVGAAGFSSIAFDAGAGELLGGTSDASGAKVATIDALNGFIVFNTQIFGGPLNLTGMTLVGSDLYLADTGGIYLSDRTKGTSSGRPLGLADNNNSDLFVLLDGGGSADTIQRYQASSGNALGAAIVPGGSSPNGDSQIESIAYFNGSLFYIDNAGGGPFVVKLDLSTGNEGNELGRQSMGTGIEIGRFTPFTDGSNPTVLRAFGRFYDQFWNIDPATLLVTGAPQQILDGGGFGHCPPSCGGSFPLGGTD